MNDKTPVEKQGKTRPVGYRVPVELLEKFDALCVRDGLDHQAQMRMMIAAWIAGREGLEGDVIRRRKV